MGKDTLSWNKLSHCYFGMLTEVSWQSQLKKVNPFDKDLDIIPVVMIF